jgi:hypothetical protein
MSSIRTASWGSVGVGKTTDAVHDLLQYHLDYPKNDIYANINIKGVKTIPINDMEVLFGINKPSFVLTDEFWTEIDSHSRGKKNDCLSLVSLRSRKKGWRLHYTLQMITQMEKRVRYVTEIWRRPWYNEDVGIMEVDIFTVDGLYVGAVAYDAWYVQKFFDSFDDPLNLDSGELLDTYRRAKLKA